MVLDHIESILYADSFFWRLPLETVRKPFFVT